MKKRINILEVESLVSKKGQKYHVCQCELLDERGEVDEIGILTTFESKYRSVVPVPGLFLAEFEIFVLKGAITASLVQLHPGNTAFKPSTVNRRIRIAKVHDKVSKSGNPYRVCSSVLLADPTNNLPLKVGNLTVRNPHLDLHPGEFFVNFDIGLDYEQRIVPQVVSLVSAPVRPIAKPDSDVAKAMTA